MLSVFSVVILLNRPASAVHRSSHRRVRILGQPALQIEHHRRAATVVIGWPVGQGGGGGLAGAREREPGFGHLVGQDLRLIARPDEVARRLSAAWPDAFPAGRPVLEKIRIWETERNICEVNEGQVAESL